MNNCYHLCNKGGKVLFRTKEDFIAVNNRFAAAGHISGVSILAASTMSNHLHFVVEAADDSQVAEFCSLVSKSYSRWYSSHYGQSIARTIYINSRKLSAGGEFMNAMLYVLKNPIHHGAAASVFGYRFSSAGYIFGAELSACMTAGYGQPLFRKYCSLSDVEKRAVCRSTTMPDDWLLSEDGMVMPFSYIDMRRIRGLWRNNIKSFLFDMNKSTAEDGFVYERDDAKDLSFFGPNDTDVCSTIDTYSKEHGLQSFHFFSDEDYARVVRKLLRLRATPNQIARCLWLNEEEVRKF